MDFETFYVVWLALVGLLFVTGAYDIVRAHQAQVRGSQQREE